MSYLYVDTMLNKLWREHFDRNNPIGFMSHNWGPEVYPVYPARETFLYGIPAILSSKLNDLPALLIPGIQWTLHVGNTSSLMVLLNFENKGLRTNLNIYIKSNGTISYEHSNYDGIYHINYTQFVFENILHEDAVLRNDAWEAFQDYLCRYLQIPEQEVV